MISHSSPNRSADERRQNPGCAPSPSGDLEGRIEALGPWFHNIKLGGVWTAPDHFLGDYPGAKFRRFAPHLPKDLSGKSVLDIGCNAGFYSIEMKRRGAGRVVGIDSDERYLAQARLATEVLGFTTSSSRKLDVYDVGALGEKFDFVIFMGVLYHLRHPLLALDLIREHVAGDMLLFQSMQRGSEERAQLEADYDFAETEHFFESRAIPSCTSSSANIRGDWTNWWVPNRACTEAMLRSRRLPIDRRIEEEVYLCRVAERPYAKFGPAAVYPAEGAARMIEAAMIWNEPNNKSHWDPEIDPEWTMFADMVIPGRRRDPQANPEVKRVLGGMSPIDPFWIERMKGYGVIDRDRRGRGPRLPARLEPVADRRMAADKIAEIEAVGPGQAMWVTEVGVGSFGAEEVQQFGVKRTAELLLGRVPRVYWYSLFDLPRTWEATTRHKEAEGSSYYRHFTWGYQGGRYAQARARQFRKRAPEMGIMQWFHWHDHRLDDAVRWMKDLGVTHLRTGLSWWDSYRDGWEDWFDRQMDALEPFETTVTFCFTPDHLGIQPHHTSPPRDPPMFADFCGRMIERYAPRSSMRVAAE